MCGISGVVAPLNLEILDNAIVKMTNTMQHRGPDAGGYYVKPGVALGHRRLSIIDLSAKANQPFIDPTGRYVIVFNGEIYNFPEIKAQLPDYNFISTSDTEVILASYIRWGVKCLGQLNGMFAFGIWDNLEKTLFVCRDRLGVKPLYYYHQHDFFAFASEIRALLSAGLIKKEISDASLEDYLLNQAITAPYTLFKNVYQLMPGQYGVFQNGEFSVHDFWRIETKIDFPGIDDSEQVKKQIRRLLTESVERRMISDVEIGAFLSGGIDSSIIVALMAQATSNPVNTFSIVFDEKEFDESRFSNIIAKKYNTKHYPITLKPKDFLDELPAALAAMDTPSGDGINSFVVSKVTRQAGFTVALSGIGGDELFAGYPHFMLFHKLKTNRLLRSSPYFLRKLTSEVSNLLWRGIKGNRFAAMVGSENFNIEHQYPLLKQVFSPKAAGKILTKSGYFNPLKKIMLDKSEDIERLPVLSQYSIAEFLGYTQNVLLKDMDQMSMANSLEVREPFFDYKLVEYVLQVPDNIKYPVYSKSLLVESFTDFVPPEIIHRPKMGFVFPWDKWLRHELKSFAESHLALLGQRKQFSAPEIDKLWNMFQKNIGGVKWIHIWQLVVLSVYLAENTGD
ncbi:MAG: asparagine synthase (glutamine-hydrolyzing) [Mucilaginibacter sp.]